MLIAANKPFMLSVVMLDVVYWVSQYSFFFSSDSEHIYESVAQNRQTELIL
jgi:hypothetical protein